MCYFNLLNFFKQQQHVVDGKPLAHTLTYWTLGIYNVSAPLTLAGEYSNVVLLFLLFLLLNYQICDSFVGVDQSTTHHRQSLAADNQTGISRSQTFICNSL
jgi:hypothetical protein